MTGADVALIGEDVRAQLDVTLRQAEALKATAGTLTITNNTEQQLATEFVARVSGIKKANETARKAEVGPLNARVTAINAAFKEPVALLDEADRIVRRALTARMAEQERLRREAEERAAEERRRAEAEAEAKRRHLEQEAARVQREAEEGDSAARLAADEAQAAADAARVAELQVQTAVVPVAAPVGPSRATSGSASTTKRWTFEINDPRAVVTAWLAGTIPAEFVIVDVVAIGKYIRAVKADHDQHPGITYKQVDGISVRTAS